MSSRIEQGRPAIHHSDRAKRQLQLDGLLAELVRQHGQYGAAAELGISYKTLRRSALAGRLSPGLRTALERYVREGPAQIESAWWRRMEEIEAQVQGIDARISAFAARLDGELADLTASAGRLAPQSMTHATPQSADIEQSEAQRQQVEEIWDRWILACCARNQARTRLEWMTAEIQQREAAFQLLRDHGLGMPGFRKLDELARDRESRRLVRAIQDAREERSRLVYRRWVCRVLTLGLWWR